MNKYIQLTFNNTTPTQNEVLIALLAEANFEGFEEEKQNLKAYIPEMNFERDQAYKIGKEIGLAFSISTIDETNWNALWESNFAPVTVDDFVNVRAEFHPPNETVVHDIIITPKMSFGTGHHATTYMMISQMRNIDLKGKSVFDFGTGTGILAIVAAKCGAASIKAIDTDQWSITNAIENAQKNGVPHIGIVKATEPLANQHYDVILANINKNVILQFMPIMAEQLNKGGILLLSGLLAEDEIDVMAAAKSAGLRMKAKEVRDKWLSLKLS